MVKKPEELKKGLHICGSDELCEESNECPYYNNERCMSAMMADADAYILTLEADKAKLQAQNAELVKQVEQLKADKKKIMETAEILSNAVTRLERERDAAVSDLKSIQGWQLCNRCKNYGRKGFNTTVCIECINGSVFEWRGVPEKEENNG